MTTITQREFRANMKAHFDKIQDNHDVLIVPRSGGKEAIVMMSISDYNSIIETDYLLSNKANRQQLEKSINELNNNEVQVLSPDDL